MFKILHHSYREYTSPVCTCAHISALISGGFFQDRVQECRQKQKGVNLSKVGGVTWRFGELTLLDCEEEV